MRWEPNTDWENIQGLKYPGYGRCIYCGSAGDRDGLRDEHIIPLALGGDTIIEKASCRKCERLISPLDTHLGRSVYGRHRIHVNAPTRRPKERPSTLPARLSLPDGDRVLDLPIKDHPYSLALPVWGEPGFWRNACIDEPFPDAFFHMYHWLPPNIRETLHLSEDQDFGVWEAGLVDVPLFARGMAKIAYCHMVLKFGLDGFRPLALPRIVLGECSAVSYFVGAPLKDPPPKFRRDAMHAINFAELKSLSGELRLYIISIRLFSHSGTAAHGMPIYNVIAGAPRSGKRRSH